MQDIQYTVPGLGRGESAKSIEILDRRMVSLIDMALTLKHIHWNVVGPNFIAVHEMLDPQADGMRAMVDQTAERIAALGGTPVGTPGAVTEKRSWDDYKLGRALVRDHLAQLDRTYTGVITDHRAAREELAVIDPVSEDMIIEHLRLLEQYQWFVRAHLQNASGDLEHHTTEP
jgi:starvation-inducible DNA-binding protein